MFGYAGKIARIDLSKKQVSTMDTGPYLDWVGGHGMGSAIFWDLCEDKTIDGYDPRNVITVMISPTAGTLAACGGARTEVQGIGVQAYPIGWYTRANFGGRFAGQLKAAGWDGVVITGAADKPVWISIVNDRVTIEDASGVWGLNTWDTQQELWRRVAGDSVNFDDWWQVSSGARDSGRTTQRPAVLCIGRAGETGSRIGSLIHEAGCGAGQGGFGGIWGKKNLKAISVIGTGTVEVADPKALMDVREWLQREHVYQIDEPVRVGGSGMNGLVPGRSASRKVEPNRITGCTACPFPCKRHYASGAYNDSQCVDSTFYSGSTMLPSDLSKATDLGQQYGLNIYDFSGKGASYLAALNKRGILGKGMKVDSGNFNFSNYPSLQNCFELCELIAKKEGIGADLSEGIYRAAKKWGTLDEDLASGVLNMPQWGYTEHWTLPGYEWFYGSLVGDRDINEHDFLFPFGTLASTPDKPLLTELFTAEQAARQVTSKMIPYQDDIFMCDFNMDADAPYGMYSDKAAKFVAWHRHSTRFWKQSVLYCDWAFPNFINAQNKNLEGFTPDAETGFFNAITGKKMTYAEGMELGRKIWNLDKAVWTLQGRTRDMEKFAPYVYKKPCRAYTLALPVYGKDGKWVYKSNKDVLPIESKVEEWKTKFYQFEGWDTATGWQTRKTLEDLGLGKVADALAKANKLK